MPGQTRTERKREPRLATTVKDRRPTAATPIPTPTQHQRTEKTNGRSVDHKRTNNPTQTNTTILNTIRFEIDRETKEGGIKIYFGLCGLFGLGEY